MGAHAAFKTRCGTSYFGRIDSVLFSAFLADDNHGCTPQIKFSSDRWLAGSVYDQINVCFDTLARTANEGSQIGKYFFSRIFIAIDFRKAPFLS
jgi:hypothetical protein